MNAQDQISCGGSLITENWEDKLVSIFKRFEWQFELVSGGLARGKLRFDTQGGPEGLDVTAKKLDRNISILFKSGNGAERDLQPGSHLLWGDTDGFTKLFERLAYDMPSVIRTMPNGSDDLNLGLRLGVCFAHGNKVTEPPILGNANPLRG